MDDVNRPLRRLEIAKRIQELRQRASDEDAAREDAALRDAAAAAGEPVPPVAGVLPSRAAEPAPSPAAEPAPSRAAEPAPSRAAEPQHPVEDDDSAAASIATLLRGGQTWILDQG